MRHIVCPVDFSELSAAALRYAGRLARTCHARLTVVYAETFSPPPYFTPGQIENLEREYRESRRQAETNLRAFVETTLGDGAVEFRSAVVEAAPDEAIHGIAAETDADLIVMGTHGRSGINRLMLGSVAERVLRASPIPVLTVRGEDRPARNVLCPVNDSRASRKALGLAAELARCLGASLTVLHVREPHAAHSIDDLCAWVPPSDRAGCTLRELTREGDPAAEILKLASETPYDLLVIGARHRPFFDSTVIGTTTARVVRHAACPVLTVVEPVPVSLGKTEEKEEVQHAL